MNYTQSIVDGRTGEEQIIPLTAEEIAEIEAREALVPALQMEEIRSKRNRLLAETDYLGLPDLGGFTPEMAAYRQALRDLPANTTDPADPVFPEKPAG